MSSRDRRDARVLKAVVDQLLVDLVGDDIDVVLDAELGDVGKLACGIRYPGGVGRIVEDQGLGLRGSYIGRGHRGSILKSLSLPVGMMTGVAPASSTIGG